MFHGASIDIGSNAVRLMIGRVNGNGNLKSRKKYREPIRLGQDVFAKGSITPKNIGKVRNAVSRFERLLNRLGVDHVMAVATSAVREASNQKQFIKKVFGHSKIPIQVISAQKEGTLIHLAVKRTLKKPRLSALLIDIGGGSVELGFSNLGNLEKVTTLPMGSVRLLRATGSRKEIHIKKQVETFRPRIRNLARTYKGKYAIAIGTGGNLECLADLKTSHRHTVHLTPTDNSELSLKELRYVINDLWDLGHAGRIKQLKLKTDRADVIVPAAFTVQMILEEFEIENLQVPHIGLREGVLWDLIDKHSKRK